MVKAKPTAQLGFVFDAPAPATAVAELSGLEQEIAVMVGTALVSDRRSRRCIAAAVSDLLGEDVSWQMLDAYSSKARIDHKVPMSRALAIIAVTNRHDLLDPVLRRIGGALLVGDEVHTARLGDVERQIAALEGLAANLRGKAPAIRGSVDAE